MELPKCKKVKKVTIICSQNFSKLLAINIADIFNVFHITIIFH